MAVDYIPFRFPGIDSVRCAFQTRRGGAGGDGPFGGANISHDVGDAPEKVAENRRLLMAGLGVDSWCELKQVHGDVLVFDPSSVPPDAPGMTEADGAATDKPGRVLVIKTADCQPILLAHAAGGHIAALHAGWRGNRMGFVQTGVARFCDRYGLDPADVRAVRGPSLGPAMAEFVNFSMEWGPDWTRWHDAAARTMDLWSLTRHQLMQAGLSEGSIFGLDLCTHTLEGMFFSYRRENRCGRQASLIWITAE